MLNNRPHNVLTAPSVQNRIPLSSLPGTNKRSHRFLFVFNGFEAILGS